MPRAAAHEVAFLSVSGQIGGAERALLDLVRGLSQRDAGARLTVIIAADGPLAAEVERLGATAIVLPLPSSVAALGDFGMRGGVTGLARFALRAIAAIPSAVRYLLRLRAALRRTAPAIVHSNGLKMHVLAACICPPSSRLVWHLHDFVGSRALMARLLRRLAPRAAAVVANSRAVADDWHAVSGRAAAPVLNAVDLERYAPHGPSLDLDALAGLPPHAPGTVRIGLIATLAAWKGHEVFLRAIARLPAELAVRAYVVSGALYQTRDSETSLHQLRSLADALALGDRVAFTGFVKDSASAMRALDVVVHASTRPEPFGLVIAEAMATGRATVVSGAGGARELIAPEVDALAFTPGDDVELAATLERLVRDPGLRARLGRAARAAAERRFTVARYAGEVDAVHRAALHAHGAVTGAATDG